MGRWLALYVGVVLLLTSLTSCANLSGLTGDELRTYTALQSENYEVTGSMYAYFFLEAGAAYVSNITEEELTAAKEAVLSALRTIHDSPGAIEGYYATATLSGQDADPEAHSRAIEKVTAEDVARVAKTLLYHSSFVLKGVGQ